MHTTDDMDSKARTRMREMADPESVEELLTEFQHEAWSEGEESCPNCGAAVTVRNLDMEAMLEDDETFGPHPARVVCDDCTTLLYEHPKWRVYELFGEEYAYTEV